MFSKNVMKAVGYKKLFIFFRKVFNRNYENNFDGLIKQSQEAKLKGKFHKAINYCNKAIIIEPLNPEAYSKRADVYLFKGDYNAAVEDCNKAVQLNPDFAFGYFNLGSALYFLGNYNLSIENYTKAIILKPDLAAAYNNRAQIYRNNGNYELSIKDFTALLELKPLDANTYIRRGDTYLANGNYELAVEDYSKAIELDQGSAPNIQCQVYNWITILGLDPIFLLPPHRRKDFTTVPGHSKLFRASQEVYLFNSRFHLLDYFCEKCAISAPPTVWPKIRWEQTQDKNMADEQFMIPNCLKCGKPMRSGRDYVCKLCGWRGKAQDVLWAFDGRPVCFNCKGYQLDGNIEKYHMGHFWDPSEFYDLGGSPPSSWNSGKLKNI